eukprot:CAMPEP_0173109570 /NCGR_PEP_ID=MMETSP1102-20130122/43610_1 /TAXON_ID=49646 /ORGANISM="Geminigera sp., Strain Caron Lab Isolate" /LENGTH=47 /DNA_ID= /DNA_START= /DNA_END= /DNA_ORIENTATION=
MPLLLLLQLSMPACHVFETPFVLNEIDADKCVTVMDMTKTAPLHTAP